MIRQHKFRTPALYLALCLSIFWSVPSPAPPAADAATALQQGANQSFFNAMMSAQAAQNSKGSASKMLQYMAMMQMMQAQANAMAAARNQKNADKQEKEDKKETKESELAKLEVPPFKAPENPPAEKPVDLSAAGSKPSKAEASLPPPPIPEVVSSSEIVRQFAAAKAEPAPSETPTPAPTEPAKNEADGVSATSVPNRIETASPNKGKEENSIGYDNGATARFAALGRPSFVSSTPVSASPAPANVTIPNVTADEGEGRRGGRGATIETGGAGTGSDGGSSGRASSDSPLSDMLSDFFGPRGGSLGGGQEQVVVQLPTKEGEIAPNLFEYASFRYRNLHKAKKVAAAPPKPLKPVPAPPAKKPLGTAKT